MSPVAPTFSQIKAQVAAIRHKTRQDVHTVGIHTMGRWTGLAKQTDGTDVYAIHQCDSPLAMRLALRDRDTKATIQVLLTQLEEEDLGTDIRLRLAKQRLFKVDRWNIVKSLFEATTIDPRLTQHHALADYLMEWVPPKGYPSVMGGFLDAETAWAVLLQECLGLISDRLDLLSLLQWSTLPENVQKYQQAPTEFQAALTDWLKQIIGPIAPAILSCCNTQNESSDAVAIGLVLDVLFHPEASGPAIDRAIGKLEASYLSQTDHPLNRSLADLWSNSALEILRLKITDPQQRQQLIARADTMLQNLGVATFAHLSDSSAIGYEQRLTNFADSILQVLKAANRETLQPLEQSLYSLTQHDLAKQTSEQQRLNQCTMALRLSRWLVHNTSQPIEAFKSLNEATLFELQHGGFVDWARNKLRQGDIARDLDKAFKSLFEQITLLREQHAQQFGQLLQSWTELGGSAKHFIPIEDILTSVVGPLVDHQAVLVILMDGMGTAACHELITHITANNHWSRMVPDAYPTSLMAGLAAIPSVTSVSRTSFFCGKLKHGTQSDESKGFAVHPALAPRCRSGSPPILFHKDALRQTDEQVVAHQVRQALSDSQNRVVGVVVNAIDDNLQKGDQINISWSLDSITILSTLLHEARQANRLVILLSDHGHVLENNTDYRPQTNPSDKGGERWHRDLESIGDQELSLTGDRVVIPETHKLVAPWSERIRYSKKDTGYHGGINPQEIVIPISILHSSNPPEKWKDAPEDQPTWWNSTLPIGQPLSSAITATQKNRSTESSKLANQNSQPDYGPLFTSIVDRPNHALQTPTSLSSWIEALLESPIYHVQQKKAGKAALAKETIQQLLVLIKQNDNTIHLVTLAKLMQLSSKQLQGNLLKLQRVLNIDGYQILTYDPTSMGVTLNVPLLKQQFGL